MKIIDRGWSDERFDAVLGAVLRTGVLVSAAIVAVGAVVYLARHATAATDYHVFHGEPGGFRTVGGILGEARSLSGRGIIQLGLLLLIGTPIARVVFSIAGFAKQRDWLYVAVTLIVFALLTYSLLGA